MNAAIIAGALLAAQYVGAIDSVLNAAIDIHNKIATVLPHRAAPIPPVSYVIVHKPKTTKILPTKAP